METRMPPEIKTLEEFFDMLGGPVEWRKTLFLAAFIKICGSSFTGWKKRLNDGKFAIVGHINEPSYLFIDYEADIEYWDWFDIEEILKD